MKSFSCSVVLCCARRDLVALGKGLSGFGASAGVVLLAGRAFEEIVMLQGDAGDLQVCVASLIHF